MPLCVGGGQHRLDEVRDGLEQMFEELPCGLTICLVQELGDCELAGSVNGHKEKELALHGLNFGDAPSRACKYALPGNEYEKKADKVSFELLPLWLVTLDIWQARNAVLLL